MAVVPSLHPALAHHTLELTPQESISRFAASVLIVTNRSRKGRAEACRCPVLDGRWPKSVRNEASHCPPQLPGTAHPEMHFNITKPQGKNVGNCLCKPARHLLTAFITLEGAEPQLSHQEGFQSCSAAGPLPPLMQS